MLLVILLLACGTTVILPGRVVASLQTVTRILIRSTQWHNYARYLRCFSMYQVLWFPPRPTDLFSRRLLLWRFCACDNAKDYTTHGMGAEARNPLVIHTDCWQPKPGLGLRTRCVRVLLKPED